MKTKDSRKIILLSMIAILAALAMSNCTKDMGKLPDPVPEPVVEACDSITYTRHIAPLLAKNCLSCHDDISKTAGIALNTYERVKDVAASGKLYGVIITGPPEFVRMPYGTSGLPPHEKDLIVCWINNGNKQ